MKLFYFNELHFPRKTLSGENIFSQLYFYIFFHQALLSVTIPFQFVFSYMWFRWLCMRWLIVNLWTSWPNLSNVCLMTWAFHILCVDRCCSLSSECSCQAWHPHEGQEEGSVLLLMGLNLELVGKLHSCILTWLFLLHIARILSCYMIINLMCLSHTGAWLRGPDIN